MPVPSKSSQTMNNSSFVSQSPYASSRSQLLTIDVMGGAVFLCCPFLWLGLGWRGVNSCSHFYSLLCICPCKERREIIMTEISFSYKTINDNLWKLVIYYIIISHKSLDTYFSIKNLRYRILNSYLFVKYYYNFIRLYT